VQWRACCVGMQGLPPLLGPAAWRFVCRRVGASSQRQATLGSAWEAAAAGRGAGCTEVLREPAWGTC
jgi:hypothetical protein